MNMMMEVYTLNGHLNFWKECVEKACHFFTTCLLPEILGNWYTRSNFKKQSSTIDLENFGVKKLYKAHTLIKLKHRRFFTMTILLSNN